MLSRSAISDEGPIPIQSDRSWQPQGRQSVIRQLLKSGIDLNLPVDEESQRRPLAVALQLESWPGGNANVFIASMLLDAGARFSGKDFAIIRTKIKDLYDYNRLYELDPCANDELFGISISRLIKAVPRQDWKLLMRGAEFEFFSFILGIFSYGWPLKTFRSFLYVDFETLFPESKGAGLGKLLSDETTAWTSQLPRILSDAISFSAASTVEATSSRQRALLYAVSAVNASVVSLLFTLDEDLDASYQDMELGHGT